MFKVLDELVYLRIVKKNDGDKYVKHFSCGNQLITLMFGQLTGKPSLRRFIIASAPIQKMFYSLGMGGDVTRSNLKFAYDWILKSNIGSIRASEACGFKQCGTLNIIGKMRNLVEEDNGPFYIYRYENEKFIKSS